MSIISPTSIMKHSSVIGLWNKGWEDASSAEVNICEVLNEIGAACRTNTSVPDEARNNFAEDAQTAVLELAFNNIVRNGLPFKNSASLVTAISDHGLLIRTYNLAYERDYRRLARKLIKARIVTCQTLILPASFREGLTS